MIQLLVFVSGLVLVLFLSFNQGIVIIKKYFVGNKSPIRDKERTLSSSSKVKVETNKGVYGSNESIQEPTPLMITPEEVKTYDDRPWRPFRWPYHQTMSIFKLDLNHWLDMDKYYHHYIEERKRIRLKYGKENYDWLPEGYDACKELMEMVSDHMVKRYPLLFTLLKDGDWATQGKIFRNELTQEVLDMTLPLKQHPLIFVSKMAKEDIFVVLKSPKDNLHYLVAAAVSYPGGSFRVDQKIGKHLDAIHSVVPYYETKLKKSMERWFDKMRPEDPVERASFYITWDTKLRVNNVFQVPEVNPNVDSELKETDFRKFCVRVERQTLRRLPRSDAIIFTNHPVFYSIDEMKDEPMIPSILRKILYEGPKDIIKYKNFERFRDYLAPYLDSLVERQKKLGIITDETPLKTQPNYPFAHWVKDNACRSETEGWTNPSPSYDKKHMKTQDFHKSKLASNE
ncbi:hypothetical protein KGF56_004553 [Candida oxycetoniae]|uniref:Uncharacterized protein n=1 Tax=Candida oxycetoniae TaxID=497107 RepID=A0AAI9STE5_9ASCO|nr:uncharacterized protein KGF56_004553 [Candida oxycetoniae]KAI3402672.1 hypothetical protein KGF56_004553 [Candida oxycetoniae]